MHFPKIEMGKPNGAKRNDEQCKVCAEIGRIIDFHRFSDPGTFSRTHIYTHFHTKITQQSTENQCFPYINLAEGNNNVDDDNIFLNWQFSITAVG